MKFLYTSNEESALQLLKLRDGKFMGNDNLSKELCLRDFLEKLPIIDKKDLLSYEETKLNLYLSEGILFSETSGSTGRSLLTPRCKSDLSWNTKNQANAYKRHLQPSLDRVAIIHPSVLSPFVEASALALNELSIGYVRLFPIPEICTYDRIAEVMEKYRITTIMTTPTLAYKTVYELKKIYGSMSNLPLNKILLTGEYISKANMNNFREVMDGVAKVAPFVYGSSETATLMYGDEDGFYRPILEDFIFEIIDSDVGSFDSLPVENEIFGSLVVTWLRKGLMPIVRYDTKDIFSVRCDNKSGGYLFRYIGRNVKSNYSLFERVNIDKAIYELPISVYDYSVRKDRNCIAISLVTDLDQAIKEEDIKDYFLSALGNDKNSVVSCSINDSDNRFYDFSPSPKQNRFQ
jgi:phenylacetate-CoA ligase